MCSDISELVAEGYKLDGQIEELLISFWEKLEAINPDAAKFLADYFGEKEFAVLMSIGKYKEGASLLETLSAEGHEGFERRVSSILEEKEGIADVSSVLANHRDGT